MKPTLLVSLLTIGLLSGCSSVYQSGQTPDDVYYSPGREGASYKEDEKKQREEERYEEYISSQDDRYLRMKVANRSRWNNLDDFDYWYDSRYDFGNCNYYSNWGSYYTWNRHWNYGLGYGGWRPQLGLGYGWSSPVYTVIVYGSPKYHSGYTSGSNISAYKNRSYNNTNQGFTNSKTGTWVTPGNNNNSFGNLVKRVFSSSANSNTSNSWDRPARTFNNSNSNSNSKPSSSTSTSSSTSSDAGGKSGGFKSSGSSSSTGRGGRGNN